METASGRSKRADRRVRPELEPLVEQLAALPEEDRVAVVEEAGARARRLPQAPWALLREAYGVMDAGGDAVEDCARLYDDG